MNMIRTSLIAAVSALSLAGLAHAQSSTTNGSTSQSEMNRGVPGVDVDTGKNARGAVDVNAGDASNDTRNMRAPRADRN